MQKEFVTVKKYAKWVYKLPKSAKKSRIMITLREKIMNNLPK